MKKLLVIALFLVACGCHNSNPIIGTPKRILSIEIAGNDFPDNMTWDEATRACSELGRGWRLPTIQELRIMYQDKDSIGGFSSEFYWSSFAWDLNRDVKWIQSFNDGGQEYDAKTKRYRVRAVRSLSNVQTITPEMRIIGTPKNLGNIEIAEKDFPEGMNWDDANAACAKLGTGWRLPTIQELKIMYLNRNKIGGFSSELYWSSLEYDYGRSGAWYLSFFDGYQYNHSKHYKILVRAVRDF
jgi:hypothetical protein